MADQLWVHELARVRHSVNSADSARQILGRGVAADTPNFIVDSPEGEHIAKQVLFDHARRLLDGYIDPWGFHTIIQPIEEIYDFPEWLGTFYDHCDWCEPSSSVSDFPHPIEYCKQRLRDASQPLTSGLAGLARELARRGLYARQCRYFSKSGLMVSSSPWIAGPDNGIHVREGIVFAHEKQEHWEALVTVHGGPHWAHLAVTLPDLLALIEQAAATSMRPPSLDKRWIAT